MIGCSGGHIGLNGSHRSGRRSVQRSKLRVDIVYIPLGFASVRAASLSDGLEGGAGGIQTGLIIGARRLLILGNDLLIGGFRTFSSRAIVHFANGRGQVIDETFGFFRLGTRAINNWLEASLQIAELLGGSVIIALFKLVKLALELAEAALFGLIDLRGERPSIATTLLELTSHLAGRMKIAALQILSSSARVAA